MTIAATSSRNDYTGSLGTGPYPFTFIADASTDVEVYIDNVLQVTGYTISGTFPGTGNVTLTTAPATSAAIALVRETPYTQSVDLVENDPMAAATLERAFDKLTILAQQVKELATRSVRVAAGSIRAAAGLVLDDPIPGNRYLRTNADCDAIDFVELTTTGTYVNPITTRGDLLVGGAGGVVERLAPPSINGSILTYAPETNQPAWAAGAVSNLTNFTDGALTAGDVLATATTCDRAVVVVDVSGCGRLYVVAAAAIPEDCDRLFQVGPPLVRSIKAQGTITRGDWIRKSATSKAVESTGIGSNCDRMVPHGAVGIAATNATGGGAPLVDAYWWGVPHRQVPVLDQLTGLAVSNNAADATNDIDIAVGAAASDDAAVRDREVIILTSAFTKRLDAAWAIGTGNGGLDTGAIANSAYHVWLIGNPTLGVADALFSLSATAPTMPTGWTKKRRLGAILRRAGAILLFTQYGDEFWLTTPVLDVDATNPGITAVNRDLTVPTCEKMLAILNAATVMAVAGTEVYLYLSSLDVTDQAPAIGAAPLASVGVDGAGVVNSVAAQVRVWANVEAKIRSRASNSGGGEIVRAATLGWLDRRGRG